MRGEAPTPRHDAIARGREMARREREGATVGLLAIAAQYLVYCTPLAIAAYQAWRRGSAWLGIAIFSLGNLAVVAWFVYRHVRGAARSRAAQSERLERRRARHDRATTD